ncbi:isocitrate lyase/PEP mutase family protein [Zwartia vadi]|uniref:isocitrate lyase/PEP mutase family protein n=1 Tax=Zwartia vadi TaxID=3058168 RepID=UPI0025B5A04E|nr:isocitrate lyase/phosphoenolpyruvate mutase family protein [Zwartia vadi]MDN3986636.1 isocitrate lyase/phosphoenolpyruvate mutase family protein [Zwartia vadi]
MHTMNTVKARLARPEILLAPGVYDALSASLAEQAGFEALYLSGASIAYTSLGRSDIGLTTYTEVSEKVAQIRDRVQIPLIVDADTGFGNALNTERTVRGFERNGANIIQLEDQSFPKRCGHLEGKSLVSSQEMVGKIKAATSARHSADTLIMARTDAVAVEGFDAALERAERYLEAGADILFVEAVRSDDQMQIVNKRFAARVPLLANMVEGGKTPVKSAEELQALGYSIAIFPGGTVRAVAHLLQNYYASLKATGSTRAFQGAMLDFDGLNAVIGTPELLARGKRYETNE